MSHMRITEGQLRRIIREEILEDLTRLDEQSAIPYSGEKSAQGLNTTNQLTYAAARGVLGATPAGARGVATGKVQVMPTAGEATRNAWNSSIMDWTLTAVGAIADLIPGPGTVLSIAIAQVQLVKFAVAQNWLGCAFAVLAMFPGVGDAIGIIGRLLKKGANVSIPIAEAAIKAIGSVADDALQDQVVTVANVITDPALRRKVADNIPKIVAAKNKFVTDLKRSIAASEQTAA
jgi:hypothetical protein